MINDPDAPESRRPRLAPYLLLVLVGICAVELINTLRLPEPTAQPAPSRRRIAPHPPNRSIGTLSAWWRAPDPFGNDIRPALFATHSAVVGRTDIYDRFQRRGSSFIYPPTAIVEMYPFGWLAERGGRQGPRRAMQTLDVFGRVLALGSLVCAALLLARVRPSLPAWVLIAVLLVVFFPVRWALWLIQAQTWVNACVVGGITAYAFRWRATSGVLLGLAACLKPHLALLVVFALLRREWRVAIAASATGILLVAISLMLVGVEPWLVYLRDVSPIIAEGYAMPANQSINGLVRRWVGDPTNFQLYEPSTAVRVCAIVAGIAALGLALWPRGVGRTAESDGASDSKTLSGPLPDPINRRAIDLGLAILALTLGSPIAWEHHYGWVIVLFAACLVGGVQAAGCWGIFATLGVAYVLHATYWLPMDAPDGGWWSLANSGQLMGAGMLFVVGWWLCTRRTEAQAIA